MQGAPRHRTILVVDIEGFNREDRNDLIRIRLRGTVRDLVTEAFTAAGIDPELYRARDLGDGVLVLIDPTVAKSDVLAWVIPGLAEGLRRHNATARPELVVRLRAVVHAGELVYDPHGPTGAELNFAFRLLDAQLLRRCLTATSAPLVLVVSKLIYRTVVRQRYGGLDPEAYEPVHLRSKDVRRAPAWIHTPGDRGVAARALRGEPLAWPRLALRQGGDRAATTATAAWLWTAQPRAPLARALRRIALLAPAPVLVAAGLVAVLWEPQAPCGPPLEVRVTAEAEIADAVRAAARSHEQASVRDGCFTRHFTVTPFQSTDLLVEALAEGWSTEALRDLGPEPDVIVPASSATVARVEANLAEQGRTDVAVRTLGSVATSPVVLASPKADLWDDERPGWDQVLAEGAAGLELVRASPASSSSGLHATIAAYQAELGITPNGGGQEVHLTPEQLQQHDAPARLRRVEQVLSTEADQAGPVLCQLRQEAELQAAPAPAAERPARDLAVLVSEKTMLDYNLGRPLGGACSLLAERPDHVLTAAYPDGLPVLDFPYVVVTASEWHNRDRERAARDFYRRYLAGGRAQADLQEAGFRTKDGSPGRLAQESNGIQRDQPAPRYGFPADRTANAQTMTAVLDAWDRVRRPARMLLVIDVSGSMRRPMPTGGGIRMGAVQDALHGALQLLGDRDQVGLWRFARQLVGNQDHQELVKAGTVGEQVGSATRRELLGDAVDGLAPTDADTGLYDSVNAAVARLRRGYQPQLRNAVVVLTDGRNEDPGGIDGDTLVQRVTGEGAPPVEVFVVSFGEASCDEPELQTLTTRTGGACLDAGPRGLDAALDTMAAILWGGRDNGR